MAVDLTPKYVTTRPEPTLRRAALGPGPRVGLCRPLASAVPGAIQPDLQLITPGPIAEPSRPQAPPRAPAVGPPEFGDHGPGVMISGTLPGGLCSTRREHAFLRHGNGRRHASSWIRLPQVRPPTAPYFDAMNPPSAQLHQSIPSRRPWLLCKPALFARQIRVPSSIRRLRGRAVAPGPPRDAAAELPRCAAPRVIHGDFRCDNMIFMPPNPACSRSRLDVDVGHSRRSFSYHLMMYRCRRDNDRLLVLVCFGSHPDYAILSRPIAAGRPRRALRTWFRSHAFNLFPPGRLVHAIRACRARARGCFGHAHHSPCCSPRRPRLGAALRAGALMGKPYFSRRGVILPAAQEKCGLSPFFPTLEK